MGPRAVSPIMKLAIRDELLNLINRGIFELATLTTTQGRNIVPTKMVLAIKHDHGEHRQKARFCVGGHRDRLESLMLHTSSPLSQRPVRIILAIASVKRWDVWSTDVDQAYLQSSSTLQKDVYCKTTALDLKPSEHLRLLLPLYGLSESGDYWSETLAKHHTEELDFKQSCTDPSLFYRNLYGKLVAVSGTYVDDILRCSIPAYRPKLDASLRTRFQCKASHDMPLGFLAMQLSRELNYGPCHVHMTPYIQRLTPLDKHATWKEYRALRAKLLWICNTRPDLSASASYAGGATEETFTPRHVREINKQVVRLQATADLQLRYPQLHEPSMHVVVYSDAAFATRTDKKSQIGYLVLLADKSRQCCLIDWNSSKARRVARSSLCAETLAFAQAFDAAYTIRNTLSSAFGRRLPLVMLTGSAGLFEIVSKQRPSTEARLLIDLHATIEAYRRTDISNVALIRSEHNHADALTK